MFRFLMICALLGLALVWVDAQWESDKRVLSLRMRSGAEIRALAVERARRLGSEWAQSWTAADATPSAEGSSADGSGADGSGADRQGVAAAPPAEGGAGSTRLSKKDSRRLDRTIKERSRP